MTSRLLANSIVTAAMLVCCSPGIAAQCPAESAARRVALLELYTSEGCDSCPPADRWVSSLPGRGIGHDRVVVLAFHVDYWNYLGWADPFAQSRFSARQRSISQRNKARVVYTPQLIFNGKDYRRGPLRDDFPDKAAAINQDPARAKISLRMHREGEQGPEVAATVSVAEARERNGAHFYLALYENNLTSQVSAGENRGKRLQHDFVVRELAGPWPFAPDGTLSANHRFRLDPRWKSADLHVAAFVQNEQTGDVLQALAAPYCR